MVLPKGNGTRWGGGERLQGNTPLSHLMAELDATLKITAGLGFSPFLCASLMVMGTGHVKQKVIHSKYNTIQNTEQTYLMIMNCNLQAF